MTPSSDDHRRAARDPKRPMDDEFRREPVPGAGTRQAVWSWVTGLAIVVLLFMAFNGVNSRRETTARASPPIMAKSSQTPTPPAAQTTGQGGSLNPEAPAGSPAR
jgi:hypothetical protein